MDLLPRPLSPDAIRSVIRAHPAIFAAIASAGSLTDSATAMQATRLLEENPQVLTTIVSRAQAIPEEQVARMGFVRHLIALGIIAVTAQTVRPETLVAIFSEELAALSIGPLGSLQ